MAVPMENSLSLGFFPGPERNTLTKQRQPSVKKSVNKPPWLQSDFPAPGYQQHLSRRMQLQQYLQELKERECSAQQRNNQLLQQFEEAQDTLKDMLARNAVMKMIRVEYERYLQENYPRWQQQIEERKRQTAQRKTMEDHLRSHIMNTEWITKSSGQHLPSQGLTSRSQQIPPPQEHPHYSQTQTARSPMSASYLAHSSSQVPTSLPPPPISSHLHPFLPLNFSSAPTQHNHWPMQDPLDWASLLADQPWSRAAGVVRVASGSESLWGQINMNKPPPEAGDSTIVGEEEDEDKGESSRAPGSPKERGGGSKRSHLSQELDMNPVRLSSSHPDSSESGRDSGLVSKEKRKKRGRIQHSSADKDKHSSQEASYSSLSVVAPVTGAQSSESETSSEKRQTISSSKRTKRGVGFAAGPQKSEEVEKERTFTRKDDSKGSSGGSRHAGEVPGSSSEKSTVRNQSPDNKSESCQESESQEEEDDDDDDEEEEEESGSNSVKIEKGPANQKEKQESNSSDESSTDDKDGENKGNMDAEEDEENQNDEEDDEVSARKTTEDEEETDAQEEDGSDKLEDEDAENKQRVSVESQDEEEENESEEGSDEEDEESDQEEEDEEEQGEDEAGEPEEERDSDDSIISPQERKPKQIQVILEEAVEEEEEEESKAGSSKNDSEGFSDEDIENLLAPQEPRQKEKSDLKPEEKKPTEVSERVQIFQVQQKESKTDHQSDSDEFDHFYD